MLQAQRLHALEPRLVILLVDAPRRVAARYGGDMGEMWGDMGAAWLREHGARGPGEHLAFRDATASAR